MLPLGRELGLGPSDIVLGTQLPLPPKGTERPQFSAHVYCGQTAAWIKMPPGLEVGLGPGDIVLDGDPVLFPKRGHSPQFSAHVCCGQTAGWIKNSAARVVLKDNHNLSSGDLLCKLHWLPVQSTPELSSR